MITIEILISMVILFMVIATSVTTLKHLKIIQKQQMNHEDFYIAVLNIKDYIEDKICIKQTNIQGSLSGYSFNAVCEKEEALQNFKKALDEGDSTGNIGNKLISLYKVTLNLQNENVEKEILYYKTGIRDIR